MPSLAALVKLDADDFRQLFKGSAIKRIGHARFIRNVLIAIGNSEDPAYLPQIKRMLDHPEALIRAAAIWALSQCATSAEFAAEKNKRAAAETDAALKREWDQSAA